MDALALSGKAVNGGKGGLCQRQWGPGSIAAMLSRHWEEKGQPHGRGEKDVRLRISVQRRCGCTTLH